MKSQKLAVIAPYSSPLRQTRGTQGSQGQGQHGDGNVQVSHMKSPATLFSILHDLNLSLLSPVLVL